MKSNAWLPLAALLILSLSAPALGQFPPAPPAPAPDPGLREVPMVQQDSSDCSNSNVNPGVVGGTVWVVRGPDGKTSVKVGITAKPNTVYHFFLKCVRILGDVTTSDEGSGIGTFSFNSNEAGNVFAFDMYPEGAPPGNKYQSGQVKY
jgi:hypothetical protein